MTVHIVTKTVTLKSDVAVSAPPGESLYKIVRLAMEQVDKARDEIGLDDPTTDIEVGMPTELGPRRWLVKVQISKTVSSRVEVKR